MGVLHPQHIFLFCSSVLFFSFSPLSFPSPLFSLSFSSFSLSLPADFWCGDRCHAAPLPTGLPTDIFIENGTMFRDFLWKKRPITVAHPRNIHLDMRVPNPQESTHLVGWIINFFGICVDLMKKTITKTWNTKAKLQKHALFSNSYIWYYCISFVMNRINLWRMEDLVYKGGRERGPGPSLLSLGELEGSVKWKISERNNAKTSKFAPSNGIPWPFKMLNPWTTPVKEKPLAVRAWPIPFDSNQTPFGWIATPAPHPLSMCCIHCSAKQYFNTVKSQQVKVSEFAML